MIDRISITQDFRAMFGESVESSSCHMTHIIRFSFVPPAGVLNESDDIALLEHLFKVFNIGDDNGPMKDIERQYREAEMVSMSVGHAVDIHRNGKVDRYVCAPIGWDSMGSRPEQPLGGS